MIQYDEDGNDAQISGKPPRVAPGPERSEIEKAADNYLKFLETGREPPVAAGNTPDFEGPYTFDVNAELITFRSIDGMSKIALTAEQFRAASGNMSMSRYSRIIRDITAQIDGTAPVTQVKLVPMTELSHGEQAALRAMAPGSTLKRTAIAKKRNGGIVYMDPSPSMGASVARAAVSGNPVSMVPFNPPQGPEGTLYQDADGMVWQRGKTEWTPYTGPVDPGTVITRNDNDLAVDEFKPEWRDGLWRVKNGDHFPLTRGDMLEALINQIKAEPDPDRRFELSGKLLTHITNAVTEMNREDANG